jgi:lipopolysaccharide transport system permease protein
MNDEVTVYEPESFIKRGYFRLIPEIAKEINKNRWLTLQLFKRDFSANFKQSFGGYLYVVLVPLMAVLAFAALKNAGVFEMGGINVPFPIYAILGTAFWQLFASAINGTTTSLASAGQMMAKINFSKKSVVLAGVGQGVVAFFVQFFIVIVLLVVYRVKPSCWIALMPLLMLPVLLMGLALGFVLSLANAVARDVSNLLGNLLNLLLFATPIMYPMPSKGLLGMVAKFNPLYYLVTCPREIILSGTFSNWQPYLISLGVSLLALTFLTIVFHMTETRIAERI